MLRRVDFGVEVMRELGVVMSIGQKVEFGIL